jgi:hypothetical protein
MLAEMNTHVIVLDARNPAAEAIACGSEPSTWRKHGRRSPPPSLLLDDDLGGMFPLSSLSSSPSSPPSLLPTDPKGKRRVHFHEKLATVCFGPIEIDSDPEGVFAPIFEGILQVVRRNVLVEPTLVEEYDRSHLAIRFQSVVDANNFAMTWMFHRFEPYTDVSAELVDGE